MNLNMRIFFMVAFVLLALTISTSKAKRGCATYGHSCFGGHGKRGQVATEADTRQVAPQPLLDPMDLHTIQLFRQLCTLQPDQYLRLAPIFTRLAENFIAESEEPLPRK